MMYAYFYPLVKSAAQLWEESREGLAYPFLVDRAVFLSAHDYTCLCKNLPQGKALLPELPPDFYEAGTGRFHSILVCSESATSGLLFSKRHGETFCAYLPNRRSICLEGIPATHCAFPRERPKDCARER